MNDTEKLFTVNVLTFTAAITPIHQKKAFFSGWINQIDYDTIVSFWRNKI